MNSHCFLHSFSAAGLLALGLGAQAQITPPIFLSEEGPTPATAPVPGEAASKAKILRLFKTPAGVHDNRLVVVYADAHSPHEVWTPKSGTHKAADIFSIYSDDDGRSWSNPTNLSNTANSYSARTDWDGDGVLEDYWGDSGKPNVFSSGSIVVVSWVDKYAPEASWTFGDVGVSAYQGSSLYPDPLTYPLEREVPYSVTYVAISADGGESWTYGGANPPLQLTYGRRDAAVDVHRGSGTKWVVTWQEDPEGLQTGEAEGPGDGSSGAKTTKGTDIWYTWTDDIVTNALALRTNIVPLSNQSIYDLTTDNGIATVGQPGQVENHGASRANLGFVKVGTLFKAIVGYEETKGIPDIEDGKTVQLHVFDYDAPVLSGPATNASGAAGTLLSDPLENSRRVRFVQQVPNGTDPALAVFWKQGTGSQGAPSDIVMRVATQVDEAAVAAAPLLNLSTNAETATMADLLLSTSANPYEDARAHRALLRGSTLILGFSYTPNGPVARYTNLENYNFWIRRSLDGGATWLAPQNLSNITDTTINVLEPRLVGTPNTGFQDDQAFLVAWGTETNVYEGIETSHPLDLFVTRTWDEGATFEPVVALGETPDDENESQIRIDDQNTEINAVFMRADEATGAVDAVYVRTGTPMFVQAMGTPIPLGEEPLRVTFIAPDDPLELYVAAASFGTTPGTVLPYGTLPLNIDLALHLSLTEPTHFVGFQGTLDATGRAVGAIDLPDIPVLYGLDLYIAFLTFPVGDPWGISEATHVRFDD
ncbi:MAG: choice-of-anchor O protein [Planctomycetota bacterium]